jgi:Flp pilus assembly protein TadG
MSRRRRLRSQSGQASIELGGMLLWLLIAGLFAWQVALVGWTAVSATNAARTASRLISRGTGQSEAEQGGQKSLSSALLQNGAAVDVDPTTDTAKVTVPIPIVLPGLTPFKRHFAITATARMPYTG